MLPKLQAELLRQTETTERVVIEVHLALAETDLKPETCERMLVEIDERVNTLQRLEQELLLSSVDTDLIDVVGKLKLTWQLLEEAVQLRLRDLERRRSAANSNSARGYV